MELTETTQHNRQKVDSSQIESIGYTAETQKLEVEFKTGSIYEYSNVEAETHEAMIKADSVGKFFGQTIKPFPEKYPFVKTAEPFSKRQKEILS